jgi:ATP-dependent RNA helicase DeaD
MPPVRPYPQATLTASPFAAAHPSLLAALTERGYLEPTPVQAAVLAPDAVGKDLLVSAQTGSGKTVAYGLAIATTLLGDAARLPAAREPLALVIAPTRELALQVQRELEWLFGKAGARVASCVGGMDIRAEHRALDRGAHLVVGTPGRLRDHLDRGRLDVSKLTALVLDEADEMLDLGFREDLDHILAATPPARRTLLFSATLPREIVALAKRHQRDALRIATSSEHASHGDIEYLAVPTPPHERDHAIVNLLRYFDVRGALVFCSTREAVRHLHGNLLERGFSVVPLSGELSQPERTRALQALRDGRARVCVATDVAARGLALPDLGLVIHADLPSDPQVLTHRSGRTGRAGRKGTCVVLVPFNRRGFGERLLAAARVDVEWTPPPSADAVRTRDQERIVAEILASSETPGEDDAALAAKVLAERTPEQIVAALVKMHRDRLPAPEDIDVSPPPPRRPAGPPRRGRPDDRDGGGVWFRVNVGRTRSADPKWLVPILCRRGNVTKREIGQIRVFAEDTRVEIAPHAADAFEDAIRRPDDRDRHVRIERVRPYAGDRPTGPRRPHRRPS